MHLVFVIAESRDFMTIQWWRQPWHPCV